MQDAIGLLKDDHTKVRGLLAKLTDDATTPEAKEALVDTIEKEIKIHTMIEEELFYPAFREAAKENDDRDMYFEAVEEHHVVDMLLPELKPMSGSSDHFRGKAKVLKELIEHHAGEEEKDMFPRAKVLLSAERLQELGGTMAERKQELNEQWDSVIAGTMRKIQSAADKFLPSSLKDLRGEMGKDK